MVDANDNKTLPAGLVAAIRKEAITQTAKWAIGAFVVLLGLALTGWWFYFQQKVDEYIAARVESVPSAAVVAFDRPLGCPKGWTMFEPAISRVILGATNGQSASPNHDQNGQSLSARPYRVTLGEEKHLLTIPEMPRHSHTAQGYRGNSSENINRGIALYDGFSGNTGEEGGSQPHNIMPPYIALFYCLKN